MSLLKKDFRSWQRPWLCPTSQPKGALLVEPSLLLVSRSSSLVVASGTSPPQTARGTQALG